MPVIKLLGIPISHRENFGQFGQNITKSLAHLDATKLLSDTVFTTLLSNSPLADGKEIFAVLKFDSDEMDQVKLDQLAEGICQQLTMLVKPILPECLRIRIHLSEPNNQKSFAQWFRLM